MPTKLTVFLEIVFLSCLVWACSPARADEIPPLPPKVAGPALTGDQTPTWSWTGGGGGNGIFRYRLDDGAWTRTRETSFTPAVDLAEGRHILRVKERDTAGNWSIAGHRAIVIDVTPPAAPMVEADTPTNDPTPTWRWSSGGGGQGLFRYRLDGGPWTGTTAPDFTPATTLAAGRHVLHVRERDMAGNWSIPGRRTIDLAPGLAIHVSPRGRDSAPGTLAEPVATIRRARDLIREIKAAGPLAQPITVFLRGGAYRQGETLVLSAQDSGSPEAPIRYQSFLNERPVISGGRPLTGPWQAHTANILVTNVGARRFNSLFVDGERAVRAREPDLHEAFPYFRIVRRENCLYQEPPEWPAECYDRFEYRARDLSASWQRLQDIEMVSLARWLQPRFRFDRIDEAARLAHVTRTVGDGWLFGFDYDGMDRYYVENFLEGLDTPGEWYLNRATGDLYYWPLPDRPIEQSSFVAPVVDQILQLGDVPAIEAQTKGYYGVYDDPRFDFAHSDFSISVWLYFPTGTANPAWALSKGEAFFTKGWGVANWSDGEGPIPSVELFINDGSGQLVARTGSHPRGQWGHFVWTVDRANRVMTAFKDGDMVESIELPPDLGAIGSDLPLEIGRYAGSITFSGRMDELRLFDRVLAPAEVRTLFGDNTYSGAAPILEHSFDENLLNTAPDPATGAWYVQSMFVDGPFGSALDFSPAGGEPLVSHPAFVHDLTLAGLEFAHTDWTLGPMGHPGSQVNYQLVNFPAAVAVAGTDVTLDNCRIRHTGRDGLRIFGQRIAVLDSEISDIGAAGIVLGSPWSTDYNYKMVASLASANRLEDNFIHSFGQVYREGPGITQFMGSGNRIAHNRIARGPCSGISAGWWSPAAWGASAGANLIEYNEIHDVARSLNDGAGIYANGSQPGTVIRNNVIHDIVATNEHPPGLDQPGTFIWGIYLDGTAADMLVRDNLVYRTAWGGIMLNNAVSGNRDNQVINNILVDGRTYQVWLGGASLDRFERNIVYMANEVPLFAINAADAIGYSDFNLFYSAEVPDLGPDWDQWRSYGFDANSIVEDPGFANYLADDFTVPDSSPAVTKLGFVMPDLATVGPRGRYRHKR